MDGEMLCSYCDYDLTGLPDQHACPECGHAYDADEVIVLLCDEPARRKEFIRQVSLAAVLLLAWLVLTLIWRRTLGLLAVLIGCAVGAVVALVRWRRSTDRTRRMILSLRGVEFRHPDLTDRVILWAEVVSADYSWVDGYLRLKGLAGEELFYCYYGPLGGAGVARRCVDEINLWIERHDTGDGSEPRGHSKN